jgi:hypothetical protein
LLSSASSRLGGFSDVLVVLVSPCPAISCILGRVVCVIALVVVSCCFLFLPLVIVAGVIFCNSSP